MTARIPRPPAEPVELLTADRSHRAVLQNPGQLYRYDLSEPYRLLPNADGTFRSIGRQVIATFPGRWSIGFQSYNPGAQRFWTQVAESFAGDAWEMDDAPPVAKRPPDTCITFRT
jgi:hypothetical protein